jgi:CBS domain-containing protein
MAALATDITLHLATLCDRAFEAFRKDMTDMFGVEMRCERRQAASGAIQDLAEPFKKLAAVHMVNAEGILRGTFSLMFDAGGMFILGGVIVMLPEPRIRQCLKRGSLDDTDSLQDAAREAGNLLVGSWDRVFREDCPGHKHFIKTDTFIGEAWAGTGPKGLRLNEPALTILYDMTVEPYPSFRCAVAFPEAVLKGIADTPTELAGVPSESEEPQAQEPCPQTPVDPVVQAPAPTSPDEAPPLDVPDASKKPAVCAAPEPRSSSRDLTDLLGVPAARIMQKDVVWAAPDDTVQDVIAKMQQHNVGYVLVGRNGVLEGLVSNSNILGAVSLYLRPVFAKWRRPEDDATLSVKVKWIMSRPVRTVSPDATVAATIETLRRCGGRCLPVVEAGGAVRGIVTVFDILLWIGAAAGGGTWQGRPPQAPALLI